MSAIDHQRRDAVKLLGQLGYRWTEDGWELPHASELPPARRLSAIDLGDMMCSELMRHLATADGAIAEQRRSEWLVEAWSHETDYFSRHSPFAKALS